MRTFDFLRVLLQQYFSKVSMSTNRTILEDLRKIENFEKISKISIIALV